MGTRIRRRSARWWVTRVSGMVGPAVFTAAWIFSQGRQSGYDVATEQISGLAAPDARDPGVMIAGFLALGASCFPFARAVEEALGGKGRAGYGPDLLRAAGAAVLVAGLARRDQMLIDRDPAHTQSLVNDIHDAASGVGYLCLVAAPIALAREIRSDPELGGLVRSAWVTSAVTAGLVGILASQRGVRWHGLVQRLGVTLPLAALARFALRLMRLGR